MMDAADLDFARGVAARACAAGADSAQAALTRDEQLDSLNVGGMFEAWF